MILSNSQAMAANRYIFHISSRGISTLWMQAFVTIGPTTHRVLKPHRNKMSVIYMQSWKQSQSENNHENKAKVVTKPLWW